MRGRKREERIRKEMDGMKDASEFSGVNRRERRARRTRRKT